MQVTTEALVLQAFPYSETSKILRLLTPDHGVRAVLARGATRPRSRYAGLLELFAEGSAILYLKPNREIQTLAGFELTRSRRRLGNDLRRFGGASLFAELVLRTGSEEPAPALFHQLGSALSALEIAGVDAIESVALAEAWALVSLLGFRPEVDRCVHCGSELRGGAGATFDVASGGLRCPHCPAPSDAPRLPARAVEDLRRMVGGEAVPLERTRGHWAVLERFLVWHVLNGAPLRSLDFLAEVALAPR